jgi:ribosomal protein S12 methylthiotransferase accessory factor
MNSTIRTIPQTAAPALESRFVDERYGLVHSLQTQFPYPGEPPIYTAEARLSYYAPDFGPNRFQGGGSGAALEESQARLSALCEGIERFCLNANKADTIIESYRHLSRQFNALSPEECPLFHPDQYPAVGFAPFTPETVIAWTWGISLPDGEPILVPADFTYLRYPDRPPEGQLMAVISTGAACGSSAADAVLRGIYEIVERDAIMLMWLNRHPCPRLVVNPQSDLGRFIERHLRSPALFHHLFWITNDLEIPACMAVLLEGEPGNRHLFAGLAANLNPEKAATKALLEAFEVRLRIFDLHEAKEPLAAPGDITSIHKHAVYYIQQDRTQLLDFLLNTLETINLASIPDQATGDPQLDLQTCLEHCFRAGQRVLAADLTKEDIRPTGLRVVRVIMPGMQRLTTNHNKPFLGNPRLYNVPVKLGWRDELLTHREINPVPHPFG